MHPDLLEPFKFLVQVVAFVFHFQGYAPFGIGLSRRLVLPNL